MRRIAVVVVVGLLTSTAAADPPVADQPVESYRLQTALISGMGLATSIATAGTQDGVRTVAFSTYLLGVPIIHLVHGRPGRALGSFAMRAGIPLAAGLFLSSMHTSVCPASSTQCDDYGSFGLAFVGLIGGAVVASVLDTAYLAKGDAPPARSWGPTVAAGHGAVALGVAGAF